MVASIGAVVSPSQGAAYYERDGYYAKDSAEHRRLSVWAGKGAEALGLEGAVDPDVFRAVLESEVPDGSGRRLGRRSRDGGIHHWPGRDLTFSAPKSVSLVALIGGDARIVDAHERAVTRALGWFERGAAETRMRDQATGRMVRDNLKGRTEGLEGLAVELLARGLSVRDIEDVFTDESGRLLLSRTSTPALLGRRQISADATCADIASGMDTISPLAVIKWIQRKQLVQRLVVRNPRTLNVASRCETWQSGHLYRTVRGGCSPGVVLADGCPPLTCCRS